MVIKKLLKKLSRDFYSSESVEGTVSSYKEMMRSKGWEIHSNLLYTLMTMIANDMLSERFTKLDQEEKDLQQRTYAHIDAICRFLLNPTQHVEQVNQLVKLNKAFEIPKNNEAGR